MYTEESAPSWQSGDPGRLAIEMTVPYADAGRNHVLRDEWHRQGTNLTPVPTLTLPRRSEGSYAVRMNLRKMADLVVQEVYSDAVSWHCQWDDRIKTVVQFGGKACFTVGQKTFTSGPGVMSASRSQEGWDWELGRGSRAIVLALPAREVRFPKNQRVITAEVSTPPARLLLAHLHSWAGLPPELNPAASWNARNATLELFHGLLSNQVIDDEQFSPALARAAMDYVESRLLDDRDLNPRVIAASLHVSVRTLHRAFTNEASSIMGYIRERRLERARSELLSTSLTVSEIAARWHFTDSSHFIRAYKRRFNELPTARLNKRTDRSGSTA